jgi:hypothetical protein
MYNLGSKHLQMTAMVVELSINTPSFADAMSRMRNWLDERRCTPVLFATNSDATGTVLIRVEFADTADAVEFRASFGPAEPKAPPAAA